MRLVKVVTSTRWLASARLRISPSRSSTCPLTGRISTVGSSSPVGRMICSTTSPATFVNSYGPGCRRHVDQLIHAVLELFEGERPVIERAGHAEAVRDQHLLTRAI